MFKFSLYVIETIYKFGIYDNINLKFIIKYFTNVLIWNEILNDRHCIKNGEIRQDLRMRKI